MYHQRNRPRSQAVGRVGEYQRRWDSEIRIPPSPPNQYQFPLAPVCSSRFVRYAPLPDPENPAPATPLEAERSLASKTIVLVRFHPHIPPRQRDSTISHQTQGRRVPYKEPRLGKTHIRSLPPTARFVSGVSTPPRPVVPRSTTLRRWPEMAPGLLAEDAFCGVGWPAVAALVPVA